MKMISYWKVQRTFEKAKDLITQYDSDASIEILKHTYPYVMRLMLKHEVHTYRIVKQENLITVIKKLKQFLLIA